jgi:glutathione-regulated potassium-efflux system ancillary protein KefC
VVVAVDNVAQSLKIVDLLRAHFPNARIVARARNVAHLYQLLERKVEAVEREVFESSLRSARSALEGLGWPAHEAREAAMRFRLRNTQLNRQLAPLYKDRAKLVAATRIGRQQFVEQMAREREERRRRSHFDWRPGEDEPRP